MFSLKIRGIYLHLAKYMQVSSCSIHISKMVSLHSFIMNNISKCVYYQDYSYTTHTIFQCNQCDAQNWVHSNNKHGILIWRNVLYSIRLWAEKLSPWESHGIYERRTIKTYSSWEHNMGLQDNVSPVYVLSLDAHMWLDLREPTFHAHNKKIHFSPSHGSCTH